MACGVQFCCGCDVHCCCSKHLHSVQCPEVSSLRTPHLLLISAYTLSMLFPFTTSTGWLSGVRKSSSQAVKALAPQASRTPITGAPWLRLLPTPHPLLLLLRRRWLPLPLLLLHPVSPGTRPCCLPRGPRLWLLQRRQQQWGEEEEEEGGWEWGCG